MDKKDHMNTPFHINVPNNPNPKKCICVSSGRCHISNLAGCPHNHKYINNNWTCVLDPFLIIPPNYHMRKK